MKRLFKFRDYVIVKESKLEKLEEERNKLREELSTLIFAPDSEDAFMIKAHNLSMKGLTDMTMFGSLEYKSPTGIFDIIN